MKSPFTNKEMIVQKENRTLTFRKEAFSIVYHCYKCKDTGEQFESEAFAALNYNQVVNQYREKYNIPFPVQIKSIRKKYGVSATKMSAILGFGANSYRNYENGEIPSLANANLILSAKQPEEFRKMLFRTPKISDAEKQKISLKINNLIEKRKDRQISKEVENYLVGNSYPSSLTGYQVPNLNKFSQMVSFFAYKLQPFKTKLNKLLFYADFEMYKQTGQSISGIQYRAIQMGPVPENFQSLYEFFQKKNFIKIDYFNFPDNGIGEQFMPVSKFDETLFSRKEIEILNLIYEKFKDTSTQNIIEQSHKEKAWLENEKTKKQIDYKYAFDLIH